MDELYKNIDGYDGKYKISNFGNVYSEKSNRILKCNVNKQGYLYVVLTNGSSYPSIAEASRKLNLDKSDIGKNCRGIRKQVGNYTFKYMEELNV